MAIYKPGRPSKYSPASGTGNSPPAKPGEYRIRDHTGTIVYIGETNNLSRRTTEHIRSGKLSATPKNASTIEYKIADGRSTSRTRRKHEKSKIDSHKPALNKSKGGEGRIAGK